LFFSGIPICVNCDLSPATTLKVPKANVELHGERAKWRAAKSGLQKADEIVASLPPGHPDGTKALQRANVDLSKAGEELQAALSAYLEATKAEKKE
jgi:hypothetical protein